MHRPLHVVSLAEGAVDLELQDEGGEVPRVGRARCHVVLAAGVEVGLCPGARTGERGGKRWRDALDVQAVLHVVAVLLGQVHSPAVEIPPGDENDWLALVSELWDP